MGSQGPSKLMVCGGFWSNFGEAGRDLGRILERSWSSKNMDLGKTSFCPKSMLHFQKCLEWQTIFGNAPLSSLSSSNSQNHSFGLDRYGRHLGGFGRDLGKVLEMFGDSCQQT